ncbi:plasmid partitioning protein RepA [Rhodovulum sulfidophilum]|uniref:Cobyrinic acid a,c-diamide synthase n=1 Tax=Rhodovulum sulfidophilum TaxID=35806 RepID=A0A0D6B9X1_RHOSU|nr:plasmid partitioning protein RepA [Rhodovulum sulfidophilum]ANB36285.1 plasmid partitioning protein RepA [Rhodovulum sulfidophilum DSM 1374]ANB40087.1 plasmid partitioning protein RepA [Rhodovulum sulfidophilum]MBK5925736.1 plasmid partitioning protein RepA [Rhodovulum sulfidophilum]MBL3552855.1 plasmid partitioning protein RepA [Rhodovulum sulfidophilum]MBL3562761.1 plasmid partitioning protein RepA [Rhodovulum sulfidophilum]
MVRRQERIDLLVGEHAQKLSERLQAHRAQLFPPDAKRTLRRFTSGEVAQLLGVKDAYLRKLHLDGKGPSPEIRANGRRYYSPENIQELRKFLEAGTKTPGTYLPGRREGDHLQVITVINFKGGSGKTTTAAHLAQKMALDGYRVLGVDLDPQASFSALHGFQPEFDLLDGGTLYDAIRYDDPVPLPRVIQKTYFTNLDIIPGNLDLMEFEHETPRALTNRSGSLFFTRVGDALAQVEGDYDVVVMDCPPQLGFLTMSALSAATAVLVTVHPQMLDVMSMCQFLLMVSNLLGVVSEAGADMSYDWLRYLITRYEPGDGPQNQMVSFMRSMFGDHVLNHPMLKSTAISDAGITKQTLYEVERSQFTRSTYERAMESLNNVNAEIEALVRQAWGR